MMKLLNELNKEELENLYAKNDFLQNQAKDGAIDELYFWANEKMYYFKDVKSLEYNFGYPGNYMYVKERGYNDFLSACLNLQKDMCIFSDETAKKIERAKARADFYHDALNGYEDISDIRWDHLDRWIKSIIKLAKDELIKDYMGEANYYYTDDAAHEYFFTSWMESNGDDYQTDGEYVYETEYRKYN